MCHRRFLSSVVLAAAAGTAAAFADDKAALAGLSFPEQIGSLKREEIVDYEAKTPGVGTGVHYLGEGVKLSVFVYPKGKTSIPDGRSSLVTSEAHAAAEVLKLMVQSGDYSDLKLEAPKRVKVGGLSFLFVAATYSERGSPRLSGYYLTGLRNLLIKIRITCRRSIESGDRELGKDFLARVAAILKA